MYIFLFFIPPFILAGYLESRRTELVAGRETVSAKGLLLHISEIGLFVLFTKALISEGVFTPASFVAEFLIVVVICFIGKILVLTIAYTFRPRH